MTTPLGSRDDGELVLAAVGDCMIDLDDPDAAWVGAAALLKSADIAFADSEGPYTTRPNRAPSSGIRLAGDPKKALSFSRAGFAVVNCATNHVMDGGDVGLMDTIEVFRSQGVATIGVGLNIEEARRPALITRKGYTVAFLGYASVFGVGYDARLDTPGLAPLRVHTVALPPMPNMWNPGATPDIITVPHPPDLDAMKQDIAQARKQADFVVVSCHWGDASRIVGITGYERQLAHAAIDAGADAVLGHHPHSLRGIELYQGKPIFYALGSFAMYITNFEKRAPAVVIQKIRERVGDEHALYTRPGSRAWIFPPECRMTAIVRIAFRKGSAPGVGVVPCYVQPDGHPEPCALESEHGRMVLEYLRRITAEAGADTRFELEGGGSLAGLDAIAVRSPEGEAPVATLSGNVHAGR